MGKINIQQQDARCASLEKEIRKLGARSLCRKFYCPILYCEEEAQLCKGHVMPHSLGSGLGWVVQRADVDNFFGSVAEERFVHGVRLRSMEAEEKRDYVVGRNLGRLFRASVTDHQGRTQPAKYHFLNKNAGILRLDTRNVKNPVNIQAGMKNLGLYLKIVDVQAETILALMHALHLGLFKKAGTDILTASPASSMLRSCRLPTLSFKQISN